jgi:hypothetical protein
VSIIDDLLKDSDFNTKVELAVQKFFEKDQIEIRGHDNLPVKAAVARADVESPIELELNNVVLLTVTLSVKGGGHFAFDWLDDEGGPRDTSMNGKFEGTVTVKFPSEILSIESKDEVFCAVEITVVTMRFSEYSDDQNNYDAP